MQILHEASDMLQAHLLADLLQRAGVPAHVQGDYLQGAVGLLPVSGLVQVVTQDDAPSVRALAREVIAQWEAQAFRLTEEGDDCDADALPIPTPGAGRQTSTPPE